MQILPVYAALLTLLFVFLSIRTIKARRRAQIAIGSGENAQLNRAMRVHANFAEYAPLGLLLIYLVEMQSAAGWFVHLLGLLLLMGRLSHAYGVSQARENFKFRVSGMMMTFGSLLLSALFLLYHAL
ncbi:MAG: MAPEG family protein [Moraxellaceae bacterium]